MHDDDGGWIYVARAGPAARAIRRVKRVRCLRFVDPGLISNGGSLISIPRCVVYRYIYDKRLIPPLAPPSSPNFFPTSHNAPPTRSPHSYNFPRPRETFSRYVCYSRTGTSFTPSFTSLHHHHHHHRSPPRPGPPAHNSSSRKHPCMTFTYSTRPRWSRLLATACP